MNKVVKCSFCFKLFDLKQDYKCHKLECQNNNNFDIEKINNSFILLQLNDNKLNDEKLNDEKLNDEKVDDIKLIKNLILNDKYDIEILRKRFKIFKKSYLNDTELINNGIPIRHQNTPEDITENITKFIIRKYEKDNTCIWCKGIEKKYCLTGDLFSNKNNIKLSIEVKSFTSDGPSQFGPNKKFDVLYFLDLRNWINDEIILWKVNLNDNSDEFKNIKVNKNQTLQEQLNEGRRARIKWISLYPQIKNHCIQIFKGTFNDILS